MIHSLVYSKPLYALSIILGGPSISVGIIFLLEFNIFIMDVFIAFIMIFNIFQIRGSIWGGEISSKKIYVYFPFWKSKNKTLYHQDIDYIEIVKNPIRLFKYSDFIRIHIKKEQVVILPRIGTSSFCIIENHIKIKWMNQPTT